MAMTNKLGCCTRDYTEPTPWLLLPSQHGQRMFSLSEYLPWVPIVMEPRQPSGRGCSQIPMEHKSGEVELSFPQDSFPILTLSPALGETWYVGQPWQPQPSLSTKGTAFGFDWPGKAQLISWVGGRWWEPRVNPCQAHAKLSRVLSRT